MIWLMPGLFRYQFFGVFIVNSVSLALVLLPPMNNFFLSKKKSRLAEIEPVIDMNMVLKTETHEILKVWKDYFSSLEQREKVHNPYTNCHNNKTDEIASIADAKISWEEINIVLTSLRQYKAASEDLISCELYKLLSCENGPKSRLAREVVAVFKHVLDTGITPEYWNKCTVVPIFKKGDRSDPTNYRGISIINTLEKVFCKILARRLATVVEKFGLIRKE
ncbi:hypothetical protein NUSPORA_02769 [Nucleospora cyclopteri]